MKCVQALALVMLAAIIGHSDSAAISEKEREVPKLWQDFKKLPRNAQTHALKALLTGEVKNALDDKIIGAIMDFVSKPEMDPYLVPHVDLNIAVETVRVNGTLNDVSVTGVSGLQINALHVSLLLLKVDFDLSLPSLSVKGNYNLDGAFNEALFLFGTGPFQIDLTGLKASGTGHAGLQDGGIIVKSLELNLGLESIHVNIQHLMGDDEVSDYINEIINDIAPTLLAEYKSQIEERVSAWLVDLVNSKLQGTGGRK